MIKKILLLVCLSFSITVSASDLTTEDMTSFKHNVGALVGELSVDGINQATALANGFSKARVFVEQFARQLVVELQKGQPLSGYQLSTLNASLEAYISLAKKMNEELIRHAPNLTSFSGSDDELVWLTRSVLFLDAFKSNNDLLYGNKKLRRAIKDLASD